MKLYRLLISGAKYHLTEYPKSAQRQKRKSLEIPEGNLVFLQDHPEGCNKIQDKDNKSDFLWFAGMQSQMSMTLQHLMVKAQCVLLTDTSCRILREPKKIKILKILMLLIKVTSTIL